MMMKIVNKVSLNVSAIGWRVLLCLLLMHMSTIAQAAIPNLYEVQVPVNSRSSDERNTAMSTALHDVLIKVSGKSNVTDNRTLVQALGQASQWVNRYTYEQVDNTVMPGEPAGLTLLVVFDQNAINQLLRDANWPIWGARRPVTIAWIAIEKIPGQRFVLDADTFDEQEALASIEGSAAMRGVPLLLPLLDLEDTSRLDVSEVWGLFPFDIMRASNRYRSDAALAARVYQNRRGQWVAQWLLLIGSETVSWQQGGRSLEVTLQAGIERMSDELGARFALAPSNNGASELLVRVIDVNSINDFHQAQAYLQQVDGVQGAEVASMSDNVVTFTLDYTGTYPAFETALERGRVLDLSPFQAFSDGVQLTYRLIP